MSGMRWMTTFRKLPTSRLSTKTNAIHTARLLANSLVSRSIGYFICSYSIRLLAEQENAAQCAAFFPTPLCTADSNSCSALEGLYHRAQFKDRKIHCDDHAADEDAQNSHDNRLE